MGSYEEGAEQARQPEAERAVSGENDAAGDHRPGTQETASYKTNTVLSCADSRIQFVQIFQDIIGWNR